MLVGWGQFVRSRGYRCAAALLILAALLVSVGLACGGGEEPTRERSDRPATPVVVTATPEPAPITTREAEHTATPQPTSTPTPQPTATPTPKPTATAVPTPTSPPPLVRAVMEPAINAETTWREVFDSSEASVQDCIRGSLRSGLAPLDNPITEDYWAEDFYPCLDPETARAIYLAAMIAEIWADGWDLNMQEEACLEDVVARIDVGTVVQADDGSAALAEFASQVIGCTPDYFVSLIAGEVGLRLEDLRREDVSCLRALLVEPGAFFAMSAAKDSAEFAGIAGQMMACIPEVFVSPMLGRLGLRVEDLSREEASCLRSLVSEPDIYLAMSSTEDSPEFAHVVGRIMGCIPDIFVSQMLREMGLRLEDLSQSEASCLRILISEPDVFLAFSASEDSPEFLRGVGRMIACIPDVFITLVIGESGLSMEDLTVEEVSCLRDLLTGENLSSTLLTPEGSPGYLDFFQRLGDCAPVVLNGQN